MRYETNFTVFPADTNYNDPPCIFGGKMLAEMDNAAAMACHRALRHTECTDCVTVKVTNVEFLRPAFVGDIVSVDAMIVETGNKSLKVWVTCGRESRKGNGKPELMAKGEFLFVARKNGVPTPHGLPNTKRPIPEP